jgi:hypothetical protein
MSRRALIVLILSAVGGLLVAGCSRSNHTGFIPQKSSTGYLEISATKGARTYSLRSDPESEFITMRWHGGNLLGPRGRTVVFSDGRYVLTYFTYQGEPTETYKTKLTKQEMDELLQLIVDSDLMNHDHGKAKVAQRRNPMEGRRFVNCIDCGSVSLTIKLAEDNCPGRTPKAPITVEIWAEPVAARQYPEVPELQGAVTLSGRLDEFRKRSRQTRLE